MISYLEFRPPETWFPFDDRRDIIRWVIIVETGITILFTDGRAILIAATCIKQDSGSFVQYCEKTEE